MRTRANPKLADYFLEVPLKNSSFALWGHDRVDNYEPNNDFFEVKGQYTSWRIRNFCTHKAICTSDDSKKSKMNRIYGCITMTNEPMQYFVRQF